MNLSSRLSELMAERGFSATSLGKKAGVSQAKRNKATVCALPSIHLPLTREARVLAIFEG